MTHHPAEVTPLKAGKPQVVEDEPVDPLSLSRTIMQIRRGDTTTPGRVRWTIAHRRKTTLGFSLGPVPTRGVVLINGEPETYLDAGAFTEVRLDADRLHRGNNTIDFAPIADPALGTPDEIAGEAGKAMASALRVVEITGGSQPPRRLGPSQSGSRRPRRRSRRSAPRKSRASPRGGGPHSTPRLRRTARWCFRFARARAA